MKSNERKQFPIRESESDIQQPVNDMDVSVVIPCLNEANSASFFFPA